MTKIYFIVLFTFMCLINTAKSQTIDPHYVDGELYIKIRDTSKIVLAPYDHSDITLNALYVQYGIDTIIQPFPGLNDTLDRTYKVKFHIHNLVGGLDSALSKLSYIDYCEKSPIFSTNSGPFTPNDLDPRQYQLPKIYAPYAWGVTKGSPSVVIAIVDNAVRITHSDLAANVWTNPNPGGILSQYPNDLHGWDVADNDNNPNPPAYATNTGAFSHGTHCSGIADATTDNGVGIASIGFNVRIMAVKCTPDTASDSGAALYYAYDGVYYAIQAGANIISMSWGGSDGSYLTGQSLMTAAYNKGIIMVAAAGNSNNDSLFYPAAFTHVLAVGATGQSDVKASYSNYGSYIGVMAPGSDIYSTTAGSDSGYATFSGTSMACPLTAGLAALIKSNNPSLTVDQVVQQIKSTCDNIDSLNPNYVGQLGAGRINAARALGVTVTTGIAALQQNDKMLWLAPNPGNGQFNLYWSGQQPLENISITDITGRELMQQQTPQLTGNSMSIHLDSSIPAGMYLLRAFSQGQAFVYRFVIQ